MTGGFVAAAHLATLVHPLTRRDTKVLTVIGNNVSDVVVDLFEGRRVRKVIACFAIGAPVVRRSCLREQCRQGEVDLEQAAQGTLAERTRACGAGFRWWDWP